ncbi:MAG: DUF4160 domain-containing protein [Thermoguttaceae bacterium]
MPRVSCFFGITISMNYNDHNPPHFHAEYGGDIALFSLETLECQGGQLPRRARALVVEWASLHRHELLTNWERAREGLPLEGIDPLD